MTSATNQAGPNVIEQLTSRGARFVPTTSRERTEQLETTPWSQRLEWREEEGIGRYLASFRLPPGCILFREGEPGTFAVILVRGQLEIRKGDADQRQHVVARPGHGQMVGEMSLIDGALRSATAVAATDTEILLLARDDFERMGREMPGLALKVALMIAASIAQLLRQTTGRLLDHRGA